MRVLNISNLKTENMSDLLGFCRQRVSERKGAFLVPMNPIKVIKARKNPEFQAIIDQADWVFPDAWGIRWAARITNRTEIPLLPGYKVMLSLLEQAARDRSSIYFLGTREDVLNIAKDELKKRYPRLRICGLHHGYFTQQEEAAVFNRIAELRPDYVFVAMGEFKQEKVIVKLRSIYPEAIYMGVGGSVDLISNRQPSPPGWMQRRHLEWVFRFFCQPFRIPRFKALPIFASLVLFEKIKSVLE